MLLLSICSSDILWSLKDVFFFFFKLTICTSNFGANRIKHVSEMELYTILSTLDKFECWNLTGLITK